MSALRSTLRGLLLGVLALMSGLGMGCHQTTLHEPLPLVSPYAEGRIFAVVPFANESGYSEVDRVRVAELFALEAEQALGIRVLPVSRSIAAMDSLDLKAPATDAQATALMNLLGADGVVIGTVTAYDAYPPLQLGMAVRLITRQPDAAAGARDLQAAARSPVGEPLTPGQHALVRSEASGFFETSNHAVRRQLDEYASGRSNPDSAFGSRIHEVSMDLYTRFVCHRLLGDLFAAERQRLAQVAIPETRR